MKEKLNDNNSINPKTEKKSDWIEDTKRWNPEPSERAKSLTLLEADEIFQVFRKWYYPCGVLLEKAFFLSGVPESFLPYPKDIISSTLEIMAKHYFDMKDYKKSKNIQEVKGSIWFGYIPDKEAWETLKNLLSGKRTGFTIEKITKIQSIGMKSFNKDHIEWLKKTGEIK